MSDRPCCSVGAREDAEAIDRALRSGEGVRAIAKRTGASKSVLGRHKSECLRIRGKVEGADEEQPVAPSHAEPERATPGLDDTTEEPVGQPVPAASHVVSRERPSVPGTSPGDARARARVDPKSLISFDDRVLFVADMVVAGRWLGRRTAKRLAQLWEIERGTVNDYHRAAAVVCKADRGSLEAQREASIGATLGIRERARASAKKNQELIQKCLDEGNDVGEAIARKALAEDRQNELAAQQHLDRIAGVLTNAAPSVNINLNSPEVSGLLRVQGAILDALFPGASVALQDGVEIWRTRGTPGLQAWLEERRRDLAALPVPVEAG